MLLHVYARAHVQANRCIYYILTCDTYGYHFIAPIGAQNCQNVPLHWLFVSFLRRFVRNLYVFCPNAGANLMLHGFPAIYAIVITLRVCSSRNNQRGFLCTRLYLFRGKSCWFCTQNQYELLDSNTKNWVSITVWCRCIIGCTIKPHISNIIVQLLPFLSKSKSRWATLRSSPGRSYFAWHQLGPPYRCLRARFWDISPTKKWSRISRCFIGAGQCLLQSRWSSANRTCASRLIYFKK